MLPEIKFDTRPLTEEEMKPLANMMLSTMSNPGLEVPLDKDTEMSAQPIAQMALKRLKAYKLNLKISNMFFAASVMTWVSNPGKVMMMLWHAHQVSKEIGNDYLTLNDWSTHLYPMGVPTEESQEKTWDSQKRPGEPLGNMVDNPAHWHEEVNTPSV